MEKVRETIGKQPLERDWNRYLFSYTNEIVVAKDGIARIGVKEKSYVVYYENPGKLHRTLELRILTLNHYGAKFCTLQTKVALVPDTSGEVVLGWPDELRACSEPNYFSIEARNYRTISNKVIDKWNAWWTDEEKEESQKR